MKGLGPRGTFELMRKAAVLRSLRDGRWWAFAWVALGNFAALQAQNRVTNPGFEHYTVCPWNQSQITHAPAWYAAYASPDLINACAGWNCDDQQPYVCVPDNIWGYQYAHTGYGYAGIIVGDSIFHPVREFLGQRLELPLDTGLYHLSFYVSLGDDSRNAIHSIGALLTVDTLLDYPVGLTPQVSSPFGVYMDDKEHWIKIEGELNAQGGEQFLTIGAFLPPQALLYEPVEGGTNPTSYYYIDDVELIHVGDTLQDTTIIDTTRLCPPVDLALPNVFTPNGDGKNELFRLNVPPDVVHMHTRIYGRFGNMVYETDDPLIWWDGRTSAGLAAPDGVYYWTCELVDACDETNTFRGYVTVLR